MKSHFILRFLIVFTILFSNLTLQSQTKSFLTESQAKEEAVIVINHIKNSHPNQYWANSKDIWDAYEKKLLDRKGFISIAQHYFDIAYLFSLATDTHTQIYPDISTPSFQTVYPIRFRSFADGLYVLAAGEGYEDYIGKKVKSFGGMPTDQFMSILANYVSADNMERKKTLAEFLLIMPDTYQVFNLSRNKAVAIELEDINGNLSSGLLKMVEDKAFAKIFFEEPDSFGILVPQGWKTVYDVLGIKKPITRKFFISELLGPMRAGVIDLHY